MQVIPPQTNPQISLGKTKQDIFPLDCSCREDYGLTTAHDTERPWIDNSKWHPTKHVD